MAPFTGFLFSVALFFFVVRVVTKDDKLDFWTCAAWVLGTKLAGFLARLALGYNGLAIFDSVVADILGTVAGIGVLTFIVHSQGYSPKQTATIIGILIVAQALPFVLVAIRAGV